MDPAELFAVIHRIAKQLADIPTQCFSKAERNIFKELCEQGFMCEAKVGDEPVAKLL